LNKRPKNKGKEIAMTIIKALVIESSPTSWWVDSAVTRHIARNRELFIDLKEKQLGEHMGITPTVMSLEKVGANSPLVILLLC
jgi:hypothetical protein